MLFFDFVVSICLQNDDTYNKKFITMINRKTVLETIHMTTDLLSMPEVISELLKEMQKENLSTTALTKIIQRDPSITGKLLKLANSPAYKRTVEISSINEAVSVLGITTVKCLALSLSIFNHKHISSASGIKSQEFFSYILLVAAGSQLLAQEIKYKVPEEAMVAGLMHDIGIIFLLRNFPEEYNKIIKKMDQGINLYKAEKSTFGIDHSEIGYYIAQHWNIPQNIANAIRHHHETPSDEETDTLSNIVQLAVLLTFDRFSGTEDTIEKRMAHIAEIGDKLNLDQDQITSIAHRLVLLMAEIAKSMDVGIIDVENLLSKANQEIWKSYLTIDRLYKEREELSQQLIIQERFKVAMETRDKAIATLSHYLNNSVMAISGQVQLLYMLHKNNQQVQINEKLIGSLEIINHSINKILAVMEEMKDISPLDYEEYFNKSYAMNIDSRIENRLKRINKEQFTITPQKEKSD